MYGKGLWGGARRRGVRNWDGQRWASARSTIGQVYDRRCVKTQETLKETFSPRFPPRFPLGSATQGLLRLTRTRSDTGRNRFSSLVSLVQVFLEIIKTPDQQINRCTEYCRLDDFDLILHPVQRGR